MRRPRVLLVRVGLRNPTLPNITPPLGILSLAAYIRQHLPVELCLIDQNAQLLSTFDVVQRAVEFQPDVAGLSVLTSFASMLAETANLLHQALPHTFIVAGGPHVSAVGKDALACAAVDAAVVGEGERAFEQILQTYREPGGLSGVPGLIWRDSAGEIRLNAGQSPLIEDLDALPFPAYDLLDHEIYGRLPRMMPMPLSNYAALFTSRGCPYHCTYCHRIFGKRFRAQSASRIVDEIEHYRRTMGVREIEFVDDTFNLVSSRVLEFAGTLRRRGLKMRISFPNALRTDILTDETIDALIEAGTYFSAFALESGSPRIQKLIRKNLNIDKYVVNVAKMVARGVFANGYSMLGFPTETEQELEATLDVMCGSRLHVAAFFTVVPFPNTELYDLVGKTHPDRLARIDYENAHLSRARVNFSAVPDEVLFACQRKAWRQFYLNPGRAWRIIRDYPERAFLLGFVPHYIKRLSKGRAW